MTSGSLFQPQLCCVSVKTKAYFKNINILNLNVHLGRGERGREERNKRRDQPFQKQILKFQKPRTQAKKNPRVSVNTVGVKCCQRVRDRGRKATVFSLD